MATKNFVDQVTVVDADWLNDVDATVYEKLANCPTVSAFAGTILDDATAADARTTLGVSATTDFSASTGSSLIGHTGGLTGSVTRTVQARLRDWMSIKDFGATGNGTTDDTAFIQAALDYVAGPGGSIFFPTGTYKITGTLYWGNGTKLYGEGADTIIQGNSLTVPMLQSKGTSLSRRYRLQIEDMKFDNTSSAASGGIGCDLRNATQCILRNVTFSNIEVGVQHYADPGLGCYYNYLEKCDFSNMTNAITYSVLSNENIAFGCRSNNVTHPIILSEGSHNHLISLALENFTTGITISGPAYDTQIISPRLENAPTSGTGINITGAPVRTAIVNPQYTSLSANLNLGSGIGTTINGRQRVTATLNFPSIAAGATSDLAVSISGATTSDSVTVTPPSTLASGLIVSAIPSTGQHYVRVANVTAGAIDPASATFTLDVRRSE